MFPNVQYSNMSFRLRHPPEAIRGRTLLPVHASRTYFDIGIGIDLTKTRSHEIVSRGPSDGVGYDGTRVEAIHQGDELELMLSAIRLIE